MSVVLNLKVSDVMKEAVFTSPNVNILSVAKLMYSKKIGSIAIVSPDDKVIGIFTERDLTKVVAENTPLTKSIGEVMSKNPWVIKESDSISKAVSLMYEKEIRHLPVVDSEGKLKGIITSRDLAGILSKLTSLE
ncbi:MAG: signal transduction protein [Caldisphaera sp.]|nr:MAG: signal transduction protein [Caldisphaera sp.]